MSRHRKWLPIALITVIAADKTLTREVSDDPCVCSDIHVGVRVHALHSHLFSV